MSKGRNDFMKCSKVEISLCQNDKGSKSQKLEKTLDEMLKGRNCFGEKPKGRNNIRLKRSKVKMT